MVRRFKIKYRLKDNEPNIERVMFKFAHEKIDLVNTSLEYYGDRAELISIELDDDED